MQSTRHPANAPSRKQWAQVLVATVLVSGCPVAIVWWLRASGAVSAALVGVALGIALSLCASFVGCVLWEKHPGSEDLLFSELMIWGFVHRQRTQRRLASAMTMVEPMGDAQRRARDGLSTEEQAKMLEQLVARVETRDPYLHGHSRRVARYAWMIAKRMGLSSEEVARVRTAAAIHDVGKIETPKEILHKKGRLSDEEFEVIKRHPVDGARMAEALHDPSLTAMVRHHHERRDGTGYPGALSGDEIPLGARIIAVADTFDAITSSRPYRAASPHRKAIDILREESGTRLDAAVVRAFCGHYTGRRPLALWASVAGLPERAASWLSSSAAGVATAAKVAAVAAVVGGTAATASFAVTTSKPRTQRVHAIAAARARPVATVLAAETRANLKDIAQKSREHVAPRRTHPLRERLRAPSIEPTPSTHSESAPSSAVASQPTSSGASGAPAAPAPATGKAEESSGTGQTTEPSTPTKSEEHSHVTKSEEAPHSPKVEEPASSTKTETPSGKPEEVAKGKTEEPPSSSAPAPGGTETSGSGEGSKTETGNHEKSERNPKSVLEEIIKKIKELLPKHK
jgi:HD domain